MTLDEAKKVAEIIGQCDGGCPVCVQRLLRMARERFPEYRWIYKEYQPLAVEHEPPRVDADGNRL